MPPIDGSGRVWFGKIPAKLLLLQQLRQGREYPFSRDGSHGWLVERRACGILTFWRFLEALRSRALRWRVLRTTGAFTCRTQASGRWGVRRHSGIAFLLNVFKTSRQDRRFSQLDRCRLPTHAARHSLSISINKTHSFCVTGVVP